MLSKLRQEFIEENNLDSNITDEEIEKIIMYKNYQHIKSTAYSMIYLKTLTKLLLILSVISAITAIIQSGASF